MHFSLQKTAKRNDSRKNGYQNYIFDLTMPAELFQLNEVTCIHRSSTHAFENVNNTLRKELKSVCTPDKKKQVENDISHRNLKKYT